MKFNSTIYLKIFYHTLKMLVSGSIGITILKKELNLFSNAELNSNVSSEKIVIILSDSHAVTNYCSVISDKNISLTEFLSKNKKNTQILIEEVPIELRNKIQLQEIWYNVPHIKELKKYVLKNSKSAEGIDIRFELLPISIDLILNNSLGESLDSSMMNSMSESKYFNELDNFFNGNGQVYNKYFNPIFKKKSIDSTKLNQLINEFVSISNDYKNIRNEFVNFKRLHKLSNDTSIIDIFKKDKEFAEKSYNSIDKLLSNIMEFYVVTKIISNYENSNVSTSILHMGLYHTHNVRSKLINKYNFEIIYENGITKFPPIENENIISCIRLPNKLSEFGIN